MNTKQNEAANEKINWIKARLAEGKTIVITTYARSIRYTSVHADWFKACASGAFVRHGKNWESIDFAKLEAHGPTLGYTLPLAKLLTSRPEFNEADCGGVFDGFCVTSDADPGM